MRKAVFITAMDRMDYFAETLKTWENVKGAEDWHILVRIEPSHLTKEMARLAEASNLTVHINPQVYGVLPHPWLGFEDLFDLGYDFVVRAEDDLLVSEEILNYFSHVAEEYKDRKEVGAVLAFNPVESDHGASLELVNDFNPWVWGTWSDRWYAHIRATWDFNYSSGGAEDSGWDWNLKKRVFPSRGLVCVRPAFSLVQNIGVWGVHGTPSNFQPAESFDPERTPTDGWTER